MQAARVLLVLVTLAACRRQPSAALELEPPAGASQPEPTSPVEVDPLEARATSLCRHSYAVLAGENPSLRAGDIERDFVDRCVAGNQTKRAELGDQRWTERATCIERADSGDALGLCDGRAPRTEPNPGVTVSVEGIDTRALCQHIIDVLMAEDPNIAAVFGPPGLETFLEECTKSADQERAQDPAQFERQYPCFMAAQKMTEFEVCDDAP